MINNYLGKWRYSRKGKENVQRHESKEVWFIDTVRKKKFIMAKHACEA